MMTDIVLACLTCGAIRVHTANAIVHISETTAFRSFVTYNCPKCGLGNALALTDRSVDMAIAVGCPKETWEWPPELAEPHDGPPIAWDDVLDAQILLYLADADNAGEAIWNDFEKADAR